MVIVCDCHYRSAICAIREFKKLKEDVIAVTVDKHKNPPAFSSKYIDRKVVLSSDSTEYKNQLIELCKEYDSPVIFPTGNFTLEILANNKEKFNDIAKFCVSDFSTLNMLNDKKWVKEKVCKYGIKVPEKYTPDTIKHFPVVVKPFCGEKFSLKAADRYKIVHNQSELKIALECFKQYDNDPIIEEYVEGHGMGICVLLNKNAQTQTYFSHKRLIEYPIDGGPSALLKTVYDSNLTNKVCGFFEAIKFNGIAMAEFKCNESGAYLLEINPRIWGSFPATSGAKSDYVKAYLNASRGKYDIVEQKYIINKKIKFSRGLTASAFSYFKRMKIAKGFMCLIHLLNPFICDPVFSIKDPIPYFREFFRR